MSSGFSDVGFSIFHRKKNPCFHLIFWVKGVTAKSWVWGFLKVSAKLFFCTQLYITWLMFCAAVLMLEIVFHSDFHLALWTKNGIIVLPTEKNKCFWQGPILCLSQTSLTPISWADNQHILQVTFFSSSQSWELKNTNAWALPAAIFR